MATIVNTEDASSRFSRKTCFTLPQSQLTVVKICQSEDLSVKYKICQWNTETSVEHLTIKKHSRQT